MKKQTVYVIKVRNEMAPRASFELAPVDSLLIAMELEVRMKSKFTAEDYWTVLAYAGIGKDMEPVNLESLYK